MTAVALIRLDSMEVGKGLGENPTTRVGHPSKQSQRLITQPGFAWLWDQGVVLWVLDISHKTLCNCIVSKCICLEDGLI